ncbi:MAG TPA: bacteriocin fulvocin C-related protein [Pyrinomonadaceae bacterium]|jgi:hypothetical protein
MNKKYNLALFTLAFAAICGLFASNIFAQKTDSPKSEPTTKQCSGEKFVMPQSIAVGSDAFDNYLKIASLSGYERKNAFGKLSNEQKASFIKVNLALQFVKRPAMTKEQREFVLDTISKVSADIYDNSNPEKAGSREQSEMEIVNKAFGLFSRQEAGDFVEPLNMNKAVEIGLLQKYNDLLKNGDITRRKIAKEMPVNDRVNIWKVQMAYHLATGKFSKAQNEFILEWLTSLSPETFAPRTNLTAEEEAKALEALESRVFSIFTKPEGYAIFMTIGIQKFVADDNLLEQPSCNCRWYCGLTGSCNGQCANKTKICGPSDNEECTARCVYPNN